MAVRILCIGNASYDIYFPLAEFPKEDQKYTIEVFLEACGGPASNAAYLLGKWGASCGFAGCVGDDVYGWKITDEFQQNNVNTELLELRKGHHTPLSCIVINSTTGSRTILNRRRTDTEMKFAPEVLKKISPRFLLFDGHERTAALEALDLFPKAVSMLDAGSLRPATRELAGKVDHLLCSESFARDITCIPDILPRHGALECAGRLIKLNPNPGCFSLGAQGLVFWENDGVFHLPAFHAHSVDTTAAGDIFHGAFLYALSSGASFRDALLTGSAAAALSTEKLGGRSSIPPADAVESFLADCRKAGQLPKTMRLDQ